MSSGPCGPPSNGSGVAASAKRDDVLAHAGRAEREHGLDGGTALRERPRPLGVDRVDDEEAQLGLVAAVAVIVERAERVQRREASACEGCGGLAQPDLGPVRRQHADAVAASEAARAEHGDPASQEIRHLRVGEIAAVLAERHAAGEPAQRGERRGRCSEPVREGQSWCRHATTSRASRQVFCRLATRIRRGPRRPPPSPPPRKSIAPAAPAFEAERPRLPGAHQNVPTITPGSGQRHAPRSERAVPPGGAWLDAVQKGVDERRRCPCRLAQRDFNTALGLRPGTSLARWSSIPSRASGGSGRDLFPRPHHPRGGSRRRAPWELRGCRQRSRCISSHGHGGRRARRYRAPHMSRLSYSRGPSFFPGLCGRADQQL